MRFASFDCSAIDDAKPLDTVFAAVFHQGCEFVCLLGRGGHDDLADPVMRNAMRRAKLVRQLVSTNAVARLKRALGIVDAGMDDAAVPGTGEHADLRQSLQNKNIIPASRKGM